LFAIRVISLLFTRTHFAVPSVYGTAPQALTTTGNMMQQQYLASTQQTPMQSRQMAPTPPITSSLPPQRSRIGGNTGMF
jgi:hypothetical protein